MKQPILLHARISGRSFVVDLIEPQVVASTRKRICLRVEDFVGSEKCLQHFELGRNDN